MINPVGLLTEATRFDSKKLQNVQRTDSSRYVSLRAITQYWSLHVMTMRSLWKSLGIKRSRFKIYKTDNGKLHEEKKTSGKKLWKGPKRRGKPCGVIAITNTSTESPTDKKGCSSKSIRAKVEKPTASLLLKNDDESDSSNLDRGAYWRAFCSSNHVTPRCYHLKEDTQFLTA